MSCCSLPLPKAGRKQLQYGWICSPVANIPAANAEPMCMTVTVMDVADVLREHLWTDSESVQLSLGYSEMSVFSHTLNEYIAHITPPSAYLKCQELLLSR